MIKQIREEEEKRWLEIKNNANVEELKKYYAELYNAIELLIKSDKLKSLLVLGKSGLGKTFNTKLFLSEFLGLNDIISISGHITPRQLFETLSDNNKNKVIILDDISEILKNNISYNLLLQALDLNKNQISWETKNGREVVDFNSKIVIIANKVNNCDALKSRCLNVELNFDYNTILEIMLLIAKQKHPKITTEKRIELIEWLKQHTTKATTNFDLRTQMILEEAYLHLQNWENFMINYLKENEILRLVIEIENLSNLNEKAKAQIFREETGYSVIYFKKLKSKLGLTNQKFNSWGKNVSI